MKFRLSQPTTLSENRLNTKPAPVAVTDLGCEIFPTGCQYPPSMRITTAASLLCAGCLGVHSLQPMALSHRRLAQAEPLSYGVGNEISNITFKPNDLFDQCGRDVLVSCIGGKEYGCQRSELGIKGFHGPFILKVEKDANSLHHGLGALILGKLDDQPDTQRHHSDPLKRSQRLRDHVHALLETKAITFSGVI